MGVITKEIHSIGVNFELTPEEQKNKLQQISDNSIRKVQEQESLESKEAELFGLNIPSNKQDKEVALADNYWLSQQSLQRCIQAYLVKQLGTSQEYLKGDEALKTLRLNQGARNKLLEDHRDLTKTVDSLTRSWVKWLKEANTSMKVTFDQDAAIKHTSATLLSVSHPFVQQASKHLEVKNCAFTKLMVVSDELPHGEHLFCIYHWNKQGIKKDETLVPIASNPAVTKNLFKLVQSSTTYNEGVLPKLSDFNSLEDEHYKMWVNEQANHVAENRQFVEYRIKSLSASHMARRKMILDHLEKADNEKIRRMKQSELVRADSDFDRRITDLKKAADSGDIHVRPLIFGLICIK